MGSGSIFSMFPFFSHWILRTFGVKVLMFMQTLMDMTFFISIFLIFLGFTFSLFRGYELFTDYKFKTLKKYYKSNQLYIT